MALMAMPALANPVCGLCFPPNPCPCPVDITVSNFNGSNVKTVNVAVSNSGLNQTNQAGMINVAKIKAGWTDATAVVSNTVGVNQVQINPITNGKIIVGNTNLSNVGTVNAAVSNSGLNKANQGFGMVNVAKIKTEGSESYAGVVNIVGQNLVQIPAGP
ncbi:MAG: hypothetical protein V1690_02800 [Candidatus Moraniibacteriota bacterium]